MKFFFRSANLSFFPPLLLAVLGACDWTGVTPPPRHAPLAIDGSGDATPTTGTTKGVAIEQARELAFALGDAEFRRAIFRELQWSSLPEHKLIWSSVLAKQRNGAYAALARRGTIPETAALGKVGDTTLALYVPIRAHRMTWNGDGNVYVAVQLEQSDRIIAFDTAGRRFYLDADVPPRLPVLALTKSELTRNQIESHAANVDVVDHSGNPRVYGDELPDCGEFIETCGGSGGPTGGGGPSTPPFPGLFMTEMTVYDKAEPWIRGDPEIEIVLSGTVSGRWYALTWPAPIQSDLHFQSGEFLVPIACSGRLAPSENYGLKRFDYNDEGSQPYSQLVLLEVRSEFAVEETVAGINQTTLFTRYASVHPPFVVQVWERDDGGECPTPAVPWFPQFTASYGLKTYPGQLNLVAMKPTGTANGWADLLGISNENDPMGSWTFATWDAFESISPNTVRYGSHVDVRLSNFGVNRFNVPSF